MTNEEYKALSEIMEKEAGDIDIYRDPLDGFGHFEHEYDIVVVAIEGAKGMNVVISHSERFPDAQIIWITSDEDFLSVAFRHHIHGFIKRPFINDEFQKLVREAIPKCAHRHEWRYVPGKAGAGYVQT